MKSKYVPTAVKSTAMILGQRCFAAIFSTEILGKKTVNIIPMIKTKIGWKDSVRRTSPMGASRYENDNATFPNIYSDSLATLSDKIALELLRIAAKNLVR